MICDTNFLSQILREVQAGRVGPAKRFMARHRAAQFVTTVISAGELAVIFRDTQGARDFLSDYRVFRLTPEIAYEASRIERELAQRLGENDNWIAGFGRYYGMPVISRDTAFDRVQGLRRLPY